MPRGNQEKPTKQVLPFCPARLPKASIFSEHSHDKARISDISFPWPSGSRWANAARDPFSLPEIRSLAPRRENPLIEWRLDYPPSDDQGVPVRLRRWFRTLLF